MQFADAIEANKSIYSLFKHLMKDQLMIRTQKHKERLYKKNDSILTKRKKKSRFY